MTDMIEKIARALADSVGPSFDMLHKNKRDWVETRGMFRGEPRDCNGPFQDDCIEAAKAALTALEGVRLVPVVWDDQERDRLEQKFVTTSEKHGHYETLFAVAAEGIRIAQERMIKAARGEQ